MLDLICPFSKVAKTENKLSGGGGDLNFVLSNNIRDYGNLLYDTDKDYEYIWDNNGNFVSYSDVYGYRYSNENLPDHILCQVYDEDDIKVLEIRVKNNEQ